MSAGNAAPLAPDATIGILGGGQLGRMLALAAARLGLKCHVLSPDPQSPAFDVVHRVTNADYTDTQALDRFAADVDVITYEFENIPAETATFLSARKPVLPDPRVLATTQDRLVEKTFIAGLGIATARFVAIDAPGMMREAVDLIGRPAVLKTRRFGYDGKGQIMLRDGVDPDAAWRAIGGQPAILEAFVPFEREISVVAVRSAAGQIECFDVTENEHRDHILKVSRAPADVTRRGRRRGVRISPAESRAHSTMSVSWRSRCSWCRKAAVTPFWSMRSRRACTIPATGRSTARRCRSSSSTSARSRAGRSQDRCGSRAWR